MIEVTVSSTHSVTRCAPRSSSTSTSAPARAVGFSIAGARRRVVTGANPVQQVLIIEEHALVALVEQRLHRRRPPGAFSRCPVRRPAADPGGLTVGKSRTKPFDLTQHDAEAGSRHRIVLRHLEIIERCVRVVGRDASLSCSARRVALRAQSHGSAPDKPARSTIFQPVPPQMGQFGSRHYSITTRHLARRHGRVRPAFALPPRGPPWATSSHSASSSPPRQPALAGFDRLARRDQHANHFSRHRAPRSSARPSPAPALLRPRMSRGSKTSIESVRPLTHDLACRSGDHCDSCARRSAPNTIPAQRYDENSRSIALRAFALVAEARAVDLDRAPRGRR